jgi:hypothetical protein
MAPAQQWACQATSDALANVACQLDRLSGTLLDVSILLVVMSTIGMALIDAAKAAFHFRYFFHDRLLDQWLERREKATAPVDAANARKQLINLAAGDDSLTAQRAWWSQPSEQMFVRFRAAAEVAIDFPDTHADLFRILVGDLGPAATWSALQPDERLRRPHTPSEGADQVDFTLLRSALAMAVTRRLEALELHFRWWWNRINQVFAIIATLIVFLVVAPHVKTSDGTPLFDCWARVPLGLLAGLLAPFAKDVKDKLSDLGLRQRFGSR